MALTLPVYTWRASLCCTSALVRAGGDAVIGGLTLGGAAQINPEPGGRATLDLAFPRFWTGAQQNRHVSWTLSRIARGAVFAIRICRSFQMVPQQALTVAETGLTWANGQPWANDENWRANPWVPVVAAAAKGSEVFQADLSTLGQVLQVGHIIGFSDGHDFTHVVMDVDYDAADIATVTVSPPLRRALATTSVMLFRPTFTGVCAAPDQAAGEQVMRRFQGLAAMTFVEALV